MDGWKKRRMFVFKVKVAPFDICSLVVPLFHFKSNWQVFADMQIIIITSFLVQHHTTLCKQFNLVTDSKLQQSLAAQINKYFSQWPVVAIEVTQNFAMDFIVIASILQQQLINRSENKQFSLVTGYCEGSPTSL